MPILLRTVLLLCLSGFARLATGAEPGIAAWPQFRGTDGQGLAASGLHLPTRFSETTGVRWKAPLPGRGHSSPVHDGRQIWLTAAEEEGRHLFVVSVDLQTGAVSPPITLFQPPHVVEIHARNSHASPSPVLVDGLLVTHFGTYGTACLDTASREVLWRNNDFPLVHDAGPGSSLVAADGLVFLTLDGADTQRVIALEIQSGKVCWSRNRTAEMPTDPITHRSFCTPLIVNVNGKSQLLSPGPHQCHAYDPRSGEELWHVCFEGFSLVPRPVCEGNLCFFCTGYMKPQLWCVDMTGSGDVTETHVRWKFKGPVSEVASPVGESGVVYMISSGGVLTAIDTQTGKRRWHARVGGTQSASPLLSNGLLYFCSEEGDVKVFDPRGKPQVVEVNHLDGGIHATPAIIDHDLLIRTDEALYRIGGDR